jgi:CHAT domain-containing protein
LMAWGDPAFARGGPTAGSVGIVAAATTARATTPAAGELRYDRLPPLPETRDELRAIAAALKADPGRDLRLGAAATRESLLEASRSGVLARKRVIVFATHGLMAGDLPGLQEPALAMAPPPEGRADDLGRNLLTLTDVLGLKLNADWVVLSACNTAAGDGRGEEALSGLARGFFYAGSRSLLVTQWAVETESAKRLTSATFEHQARVRDASKAESLRQAMLQLMAEPAYSHPAFWAAYMLVGDGTR